MKKLFLCFSTVLLVALLALGAFAAETVIYENDFSDPSTLSDFKQYCLPWEIKDGGLHLADDKVVWSHIIYQADKELTDYIVEVDYMNVQTAGGIIFNAQQDKVDTQQNGFYGQVAFLSNDATKGALGSATDTGAWKGNINVGKANSYMSANIHIKVVVKGGKAHVLMNDIDTGKTVYDYTYAIGTSASDQGFTSGTVGLRMRSNNTATLANSVGAAYFDNFKVTTANEATIGTAATGTPAAKPKTSIDTSNLVEVYRNNFDDASAIGDFSQFRGTWVVHNGALYLSAATGGQSYILYEGEKKLTELSDYVIDVDMNNVQTQGGVIVRSDVANVTGDTDDGFKGYMAFIANDGTKGALGAGQADGKWLQGNIEVSPSVLQPGMNIHLQVAVKGNVLQLTVTEQGTGKVLWTWAEANDMWSKGSFGFRLRGSKNGSLDNINTTSFDNLVVSTFGDAKAKTEVKLQIGNKTGYVNGVAKALDAAPIIRNSRTMLPVRFVAEALGATVGWDGATSTVTVTTDTTKLELVIGASTAKVNGATVTLDSPAFIESSRTYLPVRFVAENLGADVQWDGTTSTATLTK